MEPEKLKDEMEKKRKAGWVDAWLAFETVAVNRDVTESAMKTHVEKLGRIREMLVYESKFKDAVKVDKIPANLQKKMKPGAELWSQVAETKALFKDFFTLINIIMVYGPSAVEILAPKEYKMKTDEMQNIANTVAGLLHEFASAGVGGLVISGERR